MRISLETLRLEQSACVRASDKRRMPNPRRSRRIANKQRIDQKATLKSGIKSKPLSPVQQVFIIEELVAIILSCLPAVDIIRTKRVNTVFEAASDHPRCRTLTFMRSVDKTLVLPSIAENTCAALCPLLEPTATSGCRFILTARSYQLSSPSPWERMYLTNPPATDALVRLTFRNTRYWGATVRATLKISDPAGLKLGSLLSKKSRGTFYLAQSLDNHGNLNVYAPETNNNSQRSCDFEGVLEDFIEEQEREFGGSFRLHLSDDEPYLNPAIGLIDGTMVFDCRNTGRPHHVTLPGGLQCKRRRSAIRPTTPAENVRHQPPATIGCTGQTTLVTTREHCGCLAVRFGHAIHDTRLHEEITSKRYVSVGPFRKRTAHHMA